MSGTSLDGVDYALCDVSLDSIHLVEHWQVSFPKALRDRLQRAANGTATSHETGQLHHDLGRFYARHSGKGNRHPQLAALHGQTVFHRTVGSSPATLQIGEPAYLAEALRVPVISNFRAADIAAGGQGAPLATLFHQRVFQQPGKHVCINNLGGISNVTSLDVSTARPRILSFDTGPANMLLDLAMIDLSGGRTRLDFDGACAARGTPSEPLVRSWLQHQFFRRSPPKSTGREEFGEVFYANARREFRRRGLSKYDVLATLTALTARSIAYNYQRHLRRPPDLLVLTGGGARNISLRQMITWEVKKLNPRVEVKSTADFGWPEESIEASAFALLAYHRWNGIPGNLPETTGARRSVLLGQIAEAGPDKSESQGKR